MNESKKKKTAQNPSVGADGEQPKQKLHEKSITENDIEDKPIKVNSQEISLQNLSYLHTVSLNDLYDTVYPSKQPIIDGLLYQGIYLFAGTPKVGKSFLMAQLAYHVSTGQALWNYPVHQGSVLYLALEDDYRRLQARLYRMFGTEGTDALYFAIAAK